MNTMCPFCEKFTNVEVLSNLETRIVKETEITTLALYSKCSVCNNEFSTPDQMDQTLKNAFNEYRRIHNIIQPEDIIKIRNKYNISQKAFSKLLGFGELTINNYEQGAIPVKANSNLIRLVDNIDDFFKLFKENKEKLSNSQRKKVEQRLIELSITQQITHTNWEEEEFKRQDEYSGYKYMSIEKILRLIQLILHDSGKPLYKLVILKILFYCDFTFFKNYSISISGWPYARLPFGPVPNDYKQLLIEGEEKNYFESNPDEDYKGELFSLPKNYNKSTFLEIFTDKEKHIIQAIVNKCKDKSARELTDITHGEEAWKNTIPSQLISYKYAINLKYF